MKIRIVEYQYDSWRQFMGIEPDSTEDSSDDTLSHYDPHPSEGWVQVSVSGKTIAARSRMFYGVDSVSDPSEQGVYDEERVPGRSFEIEFDTGEKLTAHNAVVAESEAETAPVS